MTENLSTISAGLHQVRRIIAQTIDEVDPGGTKYPTYRLYNETGVVRDTELPSALTEVHSLMERAKNLRFTLEIKRGEHTVKYIVDHIEGSLPGGPEGPMPAAEFMRMRFALDAGMISHRSDNLPKEPV